MTITKKDIRRRLLKTNPFCHWCKKELQDYPPHGPKHPHDYATLDHIKSRVVSSRKDLQRRNHISKLVLACYDCNTGRARKEVLTHWLRMYWLTASFPRPFRFLGWMLLGIRAFAKARRRGKEHDRFQKERRRKEKLTAPTARRYTETHYG